MNMKKYFSFDDEYISGGQYFLRMLIQQILVIIIVGLYLHSVTAYKRSKSLGNSEFVNTMFAIWGFLALIIGLIPVLGIINIIPHFYLWFSNGDPKESNFADLEPAINDDFTINKSVDDDFLNKKESNANLFNKMVKKAFVDFETDLNSKNFKDYPIPFWYNIVKVRSESMQLGNEKKSIVDIQNEWIWMHTDEYSNKYKLASKKEIFQSMSIRIECFGYIYKILCSLENKLFDLAKKYNISTNPFLDQFDWDKASALASLNGSIKFAIEKGMTHSDISKLYSDFEFYKNKTL